MSHDIRSKNGKPSKYDLAPAQLSAIAINNYAECLQHQTRVENIAATYTAIAEAEHALQSDIDAIHKHHVYLRHQVGDYRIGDTIIDRPSGAVVRIYSICGDRFRCIILDRRGNDFLAHTREISVHISEIA